MYDAIVVGARCAGSPTAMLLAQKGYKVLLVDKSSFPSDILSTHYIHPPGVFRLQQWGVFDKVIASGAPPIQQAKVHFGGVEFAPPPAPVPEGLASPPALCPRRIVLDKLLVDAAVAAGVELRERFAVRELLWDGDTVAGIRGGERNGGVEERARIVIGADGMHSKVAEQVKPPEYDTQPSMSYGYYSYFSGLPLETAELYFLEDGGCLAFPTNNSQACVAVGGPIDLFPAFRQDIEANFMKTIEKIPQMVDRVKGAKREERFRGTADQPNFFRRPYGPGWALVGDAGYHRDFITGLGITDAFRDVEYLTEAIDAGFSGRQPLEEAMAGYEQKRNTIAKPLYELTLSLLSGEPPQPAQFMAFGAAMAAMMPSPAQAGGQGS
jgi:flavin-dependent dehydrogenase